MQKPKCYVSRSCNASNRQTLKREMFRRLDLASADCKCLFEYDFASLKYRNNSCHVNILVDESERYFDIDELSRCFQKYGLRTKLYDGDTCRELKAVLSISRHRRGSTCTFASLFVIAILCVVASCYLNEDLCYHEWCWENLISAKENSVDVTEHDDLISAEYSSSGNVTLSFSSDARLTSEFLEKISNDGHLSCEVTANAECIMLNLKQKKVARPDLEPTELSLSLFRKLSHVEEGVRKKHNEGLDAHTFPY